DASADADRSAHELLLERPHPAGPAQHPARRRPPHGVPGHEDPGRDRELGASSRLLRGRPIRAAAAARDPAGARPRRPGTGPRREGGLMTLDFVEPVVFGVLAAGVIVAGAAVVLINRITALATSVFVDFAFPFEVASVLLLAAMVGAIVLVKRDEDSEARR